MEHEKSITHITLTTGHQRDSFAEEIDPKLYFKFKKMFKEPVLGENDIDFIDDTCLKLTKIDDDSYICTLFVKTNEGLCPVLTTAGSKTLNLDLWVALHDSAITPVVTDRNRPPRPPFIADRIEIPHPQAIEIFKWTGDFSRCLGWMMLYPEEIAKDAIINGSK